ncbi:MAG: hypothetical protein N4A40_03340 [Tissierellales bacterium]|jgi:hypothetical protein|nr:hypothetical protein [Tissierellales bacterium]
MKQTSDEKTIENYLYDNEKILWLGKPKIKIFSVLDILIIPVTIIWLGIIVAWETMAFSIGAPFIFQLFAVPYILIGLYVLIGRYILKIYLKRNTNYCVTNQRIIILKKLKSFKVESEEISNLSIVNIENKGHNFGNVIFGNGYIMAKAYENIGLEFLIKKRNYKNVPLAFYDIENIDEVNNQIESIKYEMQRNIELSDKEK